MPGFFDVSMGVLYFGRLIKKPGYDWCKGVVIISFYFLLGLLAIILFLGKAGLKTER